jgi:hypothetical protein
MDFATESRIAHPARVVLDTMIERMEEIVPFLPSVEAIVTRSREPLADGRIHIVRHWQGSATTAPRPIRPFLSKESLGWIDDAYWVPSGWKVDWTLLTRLSGLFDCGGTNYFEPHPDDPERATRARLTGRLTVHADRLPGVPGFLARRLAPEVERFVVGLIAPNLGELAVGLGRYLDARR